MNMAWARGSGRTGGLVLCMAIAAGAACGGGSKGSGFTSGTDGGTDGESSGGDDGSLTDDSSLFGGGTLTGISVSPLTAAITSTNGSMPTEAFKLEATYQGGSTATITGGVSWTIDAPQVGAVGGSGTFTANGALGGVVHVTAAYMGKTASATLTVKLLVQENPGNVPPSAQGPLQGATTPDTTVTWAYPYNATVWPRGLLPPILQWNGGNATDDYYVHVVGPTFELQDFTTAMDAPASQYTLDATSWEKLTDSSSGPVTLTVTRFDGTNATVIANHTWTIAPASMRGIVYYWSNNLGRVLRIQPGATAPDDFASEPPNNWTSYTQSSCLMTCHTVSANGSTIISGGGIFGGSYNLQTDAPEYYLGGTWGAATGNSSSVIEWGLSAVSPDGTYILTNSMAEGLAYANDGMTMGFLGLYTTSNGMIVPTSGLSNVPVAQPAFSPDASKVVFVDPGDPLSATAPWYSSWNSPPPGDLKTYAFNESASPMFTNEQTLVATGSDPTQLIAWPTVTPDGKWVLYSRTAGADTRTAPTATDGSGPGNLYFASAVTPNQEVRLAQLNGDTYPFAAGARDHGWNFEPSFAPVAAGGYFWVVFTSRRTYGNILTGTALPCEYYPSCASDANCATDSCAQLCSCNNSVEVKQLWIAAINQNPTAGADPSHPAFHLTGQDEQNLAMRGFYSLPPCQANGGSCMSGTDCCGGYCQAGSGNSDGGGGTCASTTTGCAQNGDKCNTTSDCCGASSGTTCINHVCSEPTPQ
jgi:WD40-like Beta Propeller Repeat